MGLRGWIALKGVCKCMQCLPSRGVAVVSNHGVVYMVPEGC